MYSSDIGYAIGGNLRASCLAKGLGEDTTECKEDNWIRKNLKLEAWELTAEPDTEVAVYRHVNGSISERRGVVTSLAVYPALYLKNNVKIIDGLGTEENPYKLALIS